MHYGHDDVLQAADMSLGYEEEASELEVMDAEAVDTGTATRMTSLPLILLLALFFHPYLH